MGIFLIYTLPLTASEALQKLGNGEFDEGNATRLDIELGHMPEDERNQFIDITSQDPKLRLKVDAILEEKRNYYEDYWDDGIKGAMAEWESAIQYGQALSKNLAFCDPRTWTKQLLGQDCACLDTSQDQIESETCTAVREEYQDYEDQIDSLAKTIIFEMPASLRGKYHVTVDNFPREKIEDIVGKDMWDVDYLEKDKIRFTEKENGRLQVFLMFKKIDPSTKKTDELGAYSFEV